MHTGRQRTVQGTLQRLNLRSLTIVISAVLTISGCVRPRPAPEGGRPAAYHADAQSESSESPNSGGSSDSGESPDFGDSEVKSPYQSIQADATSMPELKGHHLVTLAVVGTNDIHGTLIPLQQKFEKTSVQTGGLSFLTSYIDILKSEMGSRVVWLDAGDEFQGSLDSNLGQGTAVADIFNISGVNAAAIGNHEFDFGQPALQSRLEQARYPYLSANLGTRSTHQLPQWKNLARSTLFEIDGVKVGVIGLTTRDTPISTIATYVGDLEFGDLAQATLAESKTLRAQGAKIILVTAHVGITCDIGRARSRSTLRKESDPLGPCDSGDELFRFLKEVPKGTVDAVVSGHSHSIVHHWIEGIPVVQGASFGRYFNVIYLTFDTQTGTIVDRLTRIEGPVPVCPKVFQKSLLCDVSKNGTQVARGPLQESVFHGEVITENKSVTKYLAPILKRNAPMKERKVGVAKETITHIYDGNSPLANLAADAIREATGADLAIINSGGVRAPIPQGPVTFESVFRSFPFENALVVLKVTGKELQNILRTAESGYRGFFAVSGLRLRLTDPSISAPLDDLDRDGKTEAWESNRILSAKLDDGSGSGSMINPKKVYRLATVDFLYNGGDGLAWAMKSLNKKNVEPTSLVMREVVSRYFEKRPEGIDPSQLKLAANGEERLTFEERALAEGPTRKGKRRTKKR